MGYRVHMASQGDLFGKMHPDRPFHVVAAHVRVQVDGTEVFVAEHLRWSRGRRRRPPPPAPREVEVGEGQFPLFGR